MLSILLTVIIVLLRLHLLEQRKLTEVQDDALLDLRALRLLESLAGRDYVLQLIHTVAGMDRITFTDYPRTDAFLLDLRELVAAEIEKRI